MPTESTRLSRRQMLASATALGAGALGAAPATAGVLGDVPRGRMRVWQLGEQRSFDTLTKVERPIPVPGPGEALIRVRFAGIAARDQGIVMQMFPVPPGPRPATRIPLSEGSGDVIAVGTGESRIRPGDRVTGCHWADWISGPWSQDNYAADVGNTIDGWLGEYVLMPARCLAKLSDAVSYEHAATLAGSGVTVWHALHEVARVRCDDIVLTLGTGGVSSFGVLLAKAAGARVVVTSSSDDKLAAMRALGADVTVNYRSNPQWGREVVEKTGGRGASVVLENVGPGTLDQSMAACAVNARIVMIGTGRPPPNPPNLYGMYLKNLSLKAISAGSRNMLENLLSALAHTDVKPVVSKIVPFDNAIDAWREIRDGDHVGKILIQVS
jgi:NADPH:quinone reductase-like Zn-dependent oxidoreductase